MAHYDVIVIGAGAAGCFTAIQIKEHYPEASVLILEKSAKALSKVKISGGGRCNVTNVQTEPEELAKNYPRGERMLKKLFYDFSSSDMVHWLEENGIPLKLYPDGCYFPLANDSQVIIDLFHAKLNAGKVPIQYQQKIQRIDFLEEGYSIKTSENQYDTKNVVLAIGGQPKITGFDFIQSLELTYVDPVPSLFTFNLPNDSVTSLMGIVQENAIVKLHGQKWMSQGPLLITHWGMSGPAILKASAFGARYLADKNYRCGFSVNWTGIENQPEVLHQLNAMKQSNKHIGNWLFPGIKARLWTYLLEKCAITETRRWNELPDKTINKLLEVLVNDTYQMEGKTTFKEEFVTAGGVSLSCLNSNSLESKKYPGLFCVGEMIDVDGITGGFNFQAAWTSGFVVAKHIRLKNN